MGNNWCPLPVFVLIVPMFVSYGVYIYIYILVSVGSHAVAFQSNARAPVYRQHPGGLARHLLSQRRCLLFHGSRESLSADTAHDGSQSCCPAGKLSQSCVPCVAFLRPHAPSGRNKYCSTKPSLSDETRPCAYIRAAHSGTRSAALRRDVRAQLARVGWQSVKVCLAGVKGPNGCRSPHGLARSECKRRFHCVEFFTRCRKCFCSTGCHCSDGEPARTPRRTGGRH